MKHSEKQAYVGSKFISGFLTLKSEMKALTSKHGKLSKKDLNKTQKIKSTFSKLQKSSVTCVIAKHQALHYGEK